MTGHFVLDASVALAWSFEDERTPFIVGILEMLRRTPEVAPALLTFELVSGLLLAERQGRIRAEDREAFFETLRVLPILIDQRPLLWLCQSILPLARRYQLTAYDAAYLELAIRENLPLATLDDELRRAAVAAGVPLVEAAA